MASLHLAWKECHGLAHVGKIITSSMTDVPGSKHGLNLKVKSCGSICFIMLTVANSQQSPWTPLLSDWLKFLFFRHVQDQESGSSCRRFRSTSD
jgi:hypothetical protein